MTRARGLTFLLAAAALTTAASPSPRPPVSMLVVQVGDAATGRFIADAQVRIPNVGRVARTKWDGEASFGGLADGKYRVQVRAIGYAPGDVDIQLAGDTVPVHFNLERIAGVLDTVRVRAEGIPLGLKEFEERRQTRIGRYFTDSTLTEHQAQGMRSFLSTRVPGLRVKGNGVVWGDGCHVNFWLDGFELRELPAGALNNGRTISNDNTTVDLEPLLMQSFAGIEVYTQATVPVKYKPSNGACNIVLLWTKW